MLRRGWLVTLVAALAMLAVPAVANAGQSFLFLQPGFTQSIFGATSQTALLGGVAFAPDSDPWVADCGFDNSALHRFDGASTVIVNGTTIHTETIGPSTSGRGSSRTASTATSTRTPRRVYAGSTRTPGTHRRAVRPCG